MSSRVELGDAFGVGLVELHRDAEGDRRHDRELVRGVDALDVEGRVGLGIAARCASLSTAAKVAPLSRISDRMKLLVPLMMPAIHSMRLAVRPSRSALMIGMPPATAASNATITPAFCAAAKISLPCARQQRLVGGDHVLAVGDRPQHQAFAGSMPPISSTTMSMSGSSTTSADRSSRRTPSTVARGGLRARSSVRVAMWVMRIGRPARRVISSSLRCSTSQVPRPTVPMPSSPTHGFMRPSQPYSGPIALK